MHTLMHMLGFLIQMVHFIETTVVPSNLYAEVQTDLRNRWGLGAGGRDIFCSNQVTGPNASFLLLPCNRLNVYIPLEPFIEIPIPSVMTLGGRAFES